MAVNLFLKQLTSMDITTAKATEKCSIFLKDTEKWIFWQKLLLYLQKEKKNPTKNRINMVRREVYSLSYLPSVSEWIIDNAIQTKWKLV